MPNLASQYAYSNPLQVLTNEMVISDVIVDHTFKAVKIMQFLMQKGLVDDKKGGAALTWVNNFGISPNTQTFDGDDPLNINSLNSNLQRAALAYKSYADALVLPITDIMDNEGSPEAVASLVEAQLDITKMSLADFVANQVVNNTQTIDPKGIDGFAAAVDDGTVAPVYASISRQQFGTRWNSYCNYQVPSTNNLLNTIHQADLNASIDGQRPDAYFCNTALFGTLIESLTPQDTYSQPDMSRAAGGSDLIFNGNPVYIDNKLPTAVPTPAANFSIGGANSFGQFLGLNSSYIKFIINPKARFSQTEWIASQTNATVFVRLFLRANLVVAKPAAHFKLYIQGG